MKRFSYPQPKMPVMAWRRCVRWLQHALLGISALLLISSCTLPGPDIDRPSLMKERTAKGENRPDAQETVRGSDDPPIVTLQLGKSLHQSNLRATEDLPHQYKVGATNLNNVPVGVALQAILSDTDIPILWESPDVQSHTVTVMNLKGTVASAAGRICRAAKVLCAYRNGALEVMQQDTFVVELPPIAGTIGTEGASVGANNTITEAIQALINGTVKTDASGGNLIYTTDAEGHDRVQSYLEQLHNGRPLIVLQLYIWEVQLSSNTALGINWSQLNPAKIGGPLENLALSSVSNVGNVSSTTGTTLGAVFSGVIDANTLASFLGTQGKLQNISSPQLTFVSGSSARFEIGGSQRYVKEIGTQNAIVGTGSTSNSVVTTDELKTGLTVSATGAYEGGVVFATLELKTADLISFDEFPAGGTTLKLPNTSDRTVQTVLRVRPGDNLVLAGLKTSRDDRKREGLPTGLFGTIPMSGSNQVTNTELVVMVRPSVVFFNDRDSLDLNKVGDKPPVPESPENSQKVAVKPDAAETAEPDTVRQPNPLQGEFGTVVKLYEDTQTLPDGSVAPAPVLPRPQPRPAPLPITKRSSAHENIQPPSDSSSGGAHENIVPRGSP